ncbi:MAG TPA: glycosyl hydrolase, partial [Patescibacteria group bacterium]|nr:glycosyl hydrolase [Patescibacteria group bacterium]
IFYLVAFFFFASPATATENTWIYNGAMAQDEMSPDSGDCKKIEPLGANLVRYTDYPKGYSVNVPAGLSLDVSFSDICSVWSDSNTRIEIYYDNFANTINDAETYSGYGKDQIAGARNHQVLADETFWQDNGQVHLLKWNRRALSRVENDKTHYASAEIQKNAQEVYTIFIKSSQPIDNEREIIQSFRLIPRQGTSSFYPRSLDSQTVMNPETKAVFTHYFSEKSPLRWGIFEPSAPENFDPLLELEEKLQYRFPFLIRYHTLEEKLPYYGLLQAYEQNRLVELTFQTYRAEGDNNGIIYAILDGQYDTYLNEYAQKLKEFHHPVLFRLNNEMNGDWCKYSSYYASKDTELYKALWRYFHKVFDDNGVDNLIWVWNPHDLSFPDFRWNHGLMYYPGDEYVDVVGLTGYNTGTYFPGEKWRSFTEAYQPVYDQYTRAFTKPLMITEFGSSSVGGDKTAWIQDMFRQIPHYPAIKAAIWWSGIDYDEHGVAGRIYKLNETEETLRAFHDNLKPATAPKAASTPKAGIEPLLKVK